MTSTPMLTYRVSRIMDSEMADQLFDALTYVGLGSFCGVQDPAGRWSLTFSFSCGCEECPHPQTVEEAREIVEQKLREEDLEFELVEAEMVDDD